ncbi:tRNA (adenosine(37)-N6)-threonylcarbamoyltransferase complex dimerization subunit type 1 TsaB [Bifidobacterium moukalabense]|uniref:Glycoprotease protein family n=1 Tax=Bifidobacterium moukalabense DSM 27321 TaxID=1435051 RepID=W4N988_9BIFI|nr:tRNA (adenosine(37)-N6)-threonylcarbamoyltransferase complex dimerization subunit type 1 TsaB [Bifidobacterium moukalabense]ETY71622.1 glycoprotease protein family [Bifidobacterium moukalabense DSM 27321]
MQTLVIDTSYGSTVGVVGHEPIVETDSRTHVEKLQVNIARAVEQAGLRPQDIERIVVGIGPAPFTGLRAGIVAAKALAFATGAELVGQDVLSPQVRLVDARANDDACHLTLAVNDARRRQLYFMLKGAAREGATPRTLIEMDIDYPQSIVQRVDAAIERLRKEHPNVRYAVDIAGHGAMKYATTWNSLSALSSVSDDTLLDEGACGLERFAAFATSDEALSHPVPVEPLYLRRPDVSVPNPLKHVLNHAGADKTE